MARWIATFLLAFLAVPAHVLHAALVCPESTIVNVTFDCTFTGLYQPGQPYDRLTIMPDGSGETLAAAGIHVSVRVHDCNGKPVVGLPASSIVLSSTGFLCICAGGNIADGPTDIEGRTTFSGTIRGGGRAENLTVFVDGTAVATIPVRTNSPDNGVASPCAIDGSDDAFFAHFGRRVGESQYSVSFDYNEDGVIDLLDLIVFGAHLGAHCE